jgi:hypothetical protein
MKLLAQLGQDGSKDRSGREDESEMGQMFRAITRGDVVAVQSVCMAEPDLVSG